MLVIIDEVDPLGLVDSIAQRLAVEMMQKLLRDDIPV